MEKNYEKDVNEMDGVEQLKRDRDTYTKEEDVGNNYSQYDYEPSDVEFVFKTESKSNDTQRLFNDIKGLQKHHSIVKIGTSKPRYIKDKAFWELYKEMHLE